MHVQEEGFARRRPARIVRCRVPLEPGKVLECSAIGFVLVVSKAKKLEVAPVAAAPEEPVDDPYLARVREMVEKP